MPDILPAALGLALLATALPAAGQTAPPPAPTAYDRAIAAGYKASIYCSAIFNAGRREAEIDRVELRGIYPEYDAIVPSLKATVDRARALVTVDYDDGPQASPRVAEWNPGAGCITWPIQAAARTGMLHREPPATRPGPVGADARPWPLGDSGIAPAPGAALAATVDRAFDRTSNGAGSETVGVIVLHRGQVVAERYAEGFGPFVSNRTWSVAKSLAGAVIGHAQHRGILDIARPAFVPEWGCCPGPGEVSRDPRTQISIDHLLRMTSGLHSDTAGNRTDALYFGGATVTGQAGSWPRIALPGTRYRYANNDTVLAVRALRAHLDDDAAYARLPSELFSKLGMRHTVAETDWEGNFILSSQVWSTARDLARFGLFIAADGVWNGERLLPEGWMRESLMPLGAQPANGPGYGRTLWLFGPDQGLPAGSYAAQGNRGQYIMVIPSRQIVVVRRGEDPAGARFDIAKFAGDVLKALP